MAWRRGLVGAFLLGLVASPAHADESEAEKLFREARQAMLEGRYDEACPLFARSQELDPSVGALLNLAACHEQQGRIASAWSEYKAARALAEQQKRADRARFAEQRASVLEPRVSWLRIEVHGDPSLTLRLDGAALEKPQDEIPLDAGAHVLEAPGYRERIELKEGEHRVVSVDFEPIPVPPPPPAPAPAPPVVIERPAPPAVVVSKSTNRFVFEPGVFLAFVQAQAGGDITVSARDSAALVEAGTERRTSCADVTGCVVDKLDVPSTGAFGFQFFGGYSWWDRLSVGLRLLVGPLFYGGLLFTVGPEASYRPIPRLTLGAFLSLGSWTTVGETHINPPFGYRPAGPNAEVEQRRGSAGAGVSIAFRLFEVEHGELLVTATPFFMGASGDRLLALPLGLAYRFR